MNKVNKLSDVQWYIDKMKSLVVHGKVSPQNIPLYYPDKEDKFSQYLSNIGISLADFSELHSNSLFENFIVANYEDLRKIKSKISYSNKDTVPKMFLNIYKNKFSKKNVNNLIVSQLTIKVCPYCNENYIINRGARHTSAQLDHFFNKTQNPLFAICLYNLVPVCATCNRIKSTKDLKISPYDHSVNREQMYITYKPKSMDYMKNPDDIDVVFEHHGTDGNNILSDIKKLHIDASYKFHTDYIQELIKKAYVYSKTEIKELYQQFPALFRDEEEVVRVVFGNYIHPDDLNKRPLSKITQDLLKELNIIL